MRVLIACEFSGVVRRAFRELGHDAWSCDLLPTEDGSPFHIQGDVLELLNQDWNLMAGFPPCTFLCRSQSGWYSHPEDRHLPRFERRPHPKFPNRQASQDEAVQFFLKLKNAPIDKIALENPRPEPRVLKLIGKPQQIIQPWEFGHGESKATCLWLKNLPPLMATILHVEKEGRVWKMTPGADRQRERSRTFQGIGMAMAMQWGGKASYNPTGGDLEPSL